MILLWILGGWAVLAILSNTVVLAWHGAISIKAAWAVVAMLGLAWLVLR